MSLRRFARYVVEKFNLAEHRTWLLNYERSQECPQPTDHVVPLVDGQLLLWNIHYAETRHDAMPGSHTQDIDLLRMNALRYGISMEKSAELVWLSAPPSRPPRPPQ